MLSKEEFQARVSRAQDFERRRNIAQAQTFYDRLVQVFQGTSLEADATAARRAFQARTGR